MPLITRKLDSVKSLKIINDKLQRLEHFNNFDFLTFIFVFIVLFSEGHKFISLWLLSV